MSQRTRSFIGRLAAVVIFLTVTASLGYYLVVHDHISRLSQDAIALAARGKFDIAAKYLKMGGSVDLADRAGFSLSFYAVAFGDHAMLRELISQGADVRRVPAGCEDLMLGAIAQQDLTSVCLLAESGQWSETEDKLLNEYMRRASLCSEKFTNDVKECFEKIH